MKKNWPAALLLGFLTACTPTPVPQEGPQVFVPPGESQGIITSVTGSVYLMKNNIWVPVEAGDLIQAPEVLRVTDGAHCEIQIGNRLNLVVGSNSLVSWPRMSGAQDSIQVETDLLAGSLGYRATGLTSKDQITLTSGKTKLQGTNSQFALDKTATDTAITVKSGSLDIVTPEGSLELKELQSALVVEGKPPTQAPALKKLVPLLDETTRSEPLDWSKVTVVRYTIKTNPPTAQIALGSRILAQGTWSSLLKVGSSLGFTISKPGFVTKDVLVESEKTEIILVDLEPAPLEAGVGEIPPEDDTLGHLETELSVERAKLKDLDKERWDLSAKLDQTSKQTKNLENLLESVRKEKSELAETLKKSEAQRKTLAEALNAKMKELQKTLDENQ